MIGSARTDDVHRDSGKWIFVDIGFAQGKTRSCGIAIHDEEPRVVNFGSMAKIVCREVHAGNRCINLLIEAPLSVAFDMEGNPKGRRIEKQGKRHSYWYEGAGVAVLTAATHLLRRIVDANPRNDIRMVEGFASFKGKPTTGINSHIEDVRKLRDVAWGGTGTPGRIVDPNCLKSHPEDDLRSAFAVAGMDLGIPPVVLLDDTQAAEVSLPGNAIG